MSNHIQAHLIREVVSGKSKTDGAIAMIILGAFFTPMLIGIPLLLFGIYRLCED